MYSRLGQGGRGPVFVVALVLAAAFLVAVVEEESCREVRGISDDKGTPSAKE